MRSVHLTKPVTLSGDALQRPQPVSTCGRGLSVITAFAPDGGLSRGPVGLAAYSVGRESNPAVAVSVACLRLVLGAVSAVHFSRPAVRRTTQMNKPMHTTARSYRFKIVCQTLAACDRQRYADVFRSNADSISRQTGS